MLKGFKDFLLRGNVIDLAVAVVIGAAFTAVVSSFTESFLRPLIGLVAGGGVQGGTFEIDGQTFAWGDFVNQLITFVLTAAVLYFAVVVPYNRLSALRKKDEPAKPASSEDLLAEIRDLLRAQADRG